jgi:hypothetical protein
MELLFDHSTLVRERFFTPRLCVKSLDELNSWLLDKCVVEIRAICPWG